MAEEFVLTSRNRKSRREHRTQCIGSHQKKIVDLGLVEVSIIVFRCMTPLTDAIKRRIRLPTTAPETSDQIMHKVHINRNNRLLNMQM